jgi:hypothetical protein
MEAHQRNGTKDVGVPIQHIEGGGGLPTGRVRPRSVSDDDSTVPQAFRISFSCEHRGRYFRSTKRYIRW